MDLVRKNDHVRVEQGGRPRESPPRDSPTNQSNGTLGLNGISFSLSFSSHISHPFSFVHSLSLSLSLNSKINADRHWKREKAKWRWRRKSGLQFSFISLCTHSLLLPPLPHNPNRRCPPPLKKINLGSLNIRAHETYLFNFHCFLRRQKRHLG